MSDNVITVDSLSKAYKIGLREAHGRTFREAFTDAVLAPFRRLGRAASGGDGNGNAEDTFWALKNVSFDVKRGEVVGIIGRNGAGKSTLLKILSRITEPTSGCVRLRGRVASLLEIGTGFHPELTGRENIYLNGAILGMKRAEITQKFDEIVAFSEIEKFLDTPVKRYSSGMHVRLAFAVAAHLEPEILVVDEVLAVGDAEFQKKCLGKMQDVAKGLGRTVLFVSHNMAAIEELCTVGVVLERGQITFVGPTHEAASRYLRRSFDARAADCSCKIGPFAIHAAAVRGGEGAVRSFDTIAVEVDLTPDRDIPSLGVRVFIESARGDSVADLDPYPAHPRLPLAASQRVRVRIPLLRLPLRPGEYRIRMLLRDDGHFLSWEMPSLLVFNVEPSLDARLNNWNGAIQGTTAIEFNQTAEVIP